MVPYHPEPGPRSSGSLVDVLDRVLDKGLVIAGDIRVSLADVELLTIRIRLLVCSIDKAEEIGLDWWRADPELSSGARMFANENESLRERIRLLEDKLARLSALPAGSGDGSGAAAERRSDRSSDRRSSDPLSSDPLSSDPGKSPARRARKSRKK